MPTRMLSRYENEHPSLTPHWRQVTSKRYDSLPAVDVVVGSWVCVVDCELPNQNHIQLFCFWVAAWLFEGTVEATRLIMKISFSETSLSSIKPVLSALYRIFLFIIEWGFKKRSQTPLLSFQPPNISQNCRTQNSRLEHWFNAFQSSTPTPSSHDQRKLKQRTNCSGQRVVLLPMASVIQTWSGGLQGRMAYNDLIFGRSLKMSASFLSVPS